jgi:Protein of unknown function (DUF2501)
MSARIYRTTVTAILITVSLYLPTAYAQLGGLLNQGGNSGSSGAPGNLGGLGGMTGGLSAQSLTSGSIGNVAGVLEYCIKNNYLTSNSASSVKDSLMGKLPGGTSSSDSGYANGAKGILDSSNGKKLD